MPIRQCLTLSLLVAAACWCDPLSADEDAVRDSDTSVYESLADVPIGTLFFSTTERRRLDALRQGVVPRKASSTDQSSGARMRNDSAAGFISSTNGRTQVFRNGDFRPAEATTAVRFPGEVEILINSPDRSARQPQLTLKSALTQSEASESNPPSNHDAADSDEGQ